MKTTLFSRLAVITAFTLLAFVHKLNAQPTCPYNINNNMGCDVVVRYTLYDKYCNVCYSSPDIVISGGNFYTIPCSVFALCPNACDIDILLVNDNNVTVWTTVNGSIGSIAVPGAPCTGSDKMVWNTGSTDINP